MKGDFSRLTFDQGKHYSSVRMQQGRVQLDADWNEQADINMYQRQTLARDNIGAHGGPQENAGYEISVVENRLTLSQGRYYVNGILCENPATISYEEQADLPGAKQPTSEEKTGLYVAYMDVWHHHQTSVDDQNLQEVAIGGADTTTRTKIVSPVKLTKLGGMPNGNSPQDYVSSLIAGLQQPEWQPSGSESTGRLQARVATGFSGELENQLLRIEVHDGGEGGVATFKWSSNNGTLIAAIKEGPSVTGNQYSIKIIPGEWDLGFMPGQWVEITDDEQILAGKPGIMVKLTEVSDEELVFMTDNEFIHEIGLHSPATVRQWDSEWNSESRFVKTDGYIQLENGIEVHFGEGLYQTGDSWLVPCRSLLGNILWPEDQDGDPIASKPHNSSHQYAALALLGFDGFTWSLEKDLRKIFLSSTEATKETVSRAGDSMYGPLTIQNTLEVDESITTHQDLIVHGKLEVNGEVIGDPIGVIKMYDGQSWQDNITIPGWYACIPQNHGPEFAAKHNGIDCPDLTDRFIMGGSVSGTMGGDNRPQITISHMPSHDHSGMTENNNQGHAHKGFTETISSWHKHDFSTKKPNADHSHSTGFGRGWPKGGGKFGGAEYAGGLHTGGISSWHTHSGTTDNPNANHRHKFITDGQSANHNHNISSQGKGEAWENRPAFYQLIFIKRVE